ncbi:MAG TPA: asparaginase [Streptosporangiaceae bacterium]|nr:asparaginase [Streptosporangiaceae bacterium]
MTADNPVLAEVVRSGFTESRHRGIAVALAADGQPRLAAGAVREPVFPRSANKPLQATAMLRCGLKLDGELLALAAASHSGEEFHVAGVREILSGAGLTEKALQCPPDWPLDEEARRALILAGGSADRVHMNCSGKHAAMLATCVVNGWPTETYTDPAHPLQQEIRRAVSELADEPVAAIGVDGCGAPLMAISVLGLARAFRALVLAADGTAERAVADAMRAFPAWTSGTTRPERFLMEAVPGLLLKGGAEGVDGFALADGRAGALKIDDGAARARVPVTVALLRELGVTAEPGADAARLAELASPDVFGGGRVVGEIRAVLPGAG